MSGGESANDTGGVKEMEATHDTRTTEKGTTWTWPPAAATPELARLLPHPAADANKYTRGHLSLVAGLGRLPGSGLPGGRGPASGPAPATPRCSARGNR